MTDNDIITALRHHIHSAHCADGFEKVYWGTLNEALELINRQKAEIEKYDEIQTTINRFWDILLQFKVAHRKEKPTLEELADSIAQIESEAIKEFCGRIERVLSMHPSQRRYYDEIKKEFIKETENEK